ncbi:hypothetical protein [Saccharothrix sp. ST-888]|uniref:hypothetical protein n=1 Tax=Saccharothrix sp. ST-888 TaxID=1427391 RepID=UPI0005ED324C|nr:hypothetical protein [Saccharothrix sp. ST-888]KJK57726.1 hypothetical protein UK12_14780 [Saccharothrix sp. ST-888]
MISRIAGLVVGTAAVLAAAAGPALAAPAASEAVNPACLAALNRPCAWQQPNTTGTGIIGSARVDAVDDQLTLLRVEVRIQRAWGSPWQTVASSTMIRSGSIQLSTPAVVTDYRTMVCATGGPAESAEQQVTICTR